MASRRPENPGQNQSHPSKQKCYHVTIFSKAENHLRGLSEHLDLSKLWDRKTLEAEGTLIIAAWFDERWGPTDVFSDYGYSHLQIDEDQLSGHLHLLAIKDGQWTTPDVYVEDNQDSMFIDLQNGTAK